MKEINIPSNDKNSLKAAHRRSTAGRTVATIILGATGIGILADAGNSLLNHDSGHNADQGTNITGAKLVNSSQGKPDRSVKGLLGKPNSIPNGQNIIVTFGGKEVEKLGGNNNGDPTIWALADAVIKNTVGYGNRAATGANINKVTIQGDKAISEYYTADPQGGGFVEYGSSHEFEVKHGTNLSALEKELLKADMSERKV